MKRARYGDEMKYDKPRDSLRASALAMVWLAQVRRFRSSRVSTRSLEQVNILSKISSIKSRAEQRTNSRSLNDP